jgi:hypothetical protein
MEARNDGMRAICGGGREDVGQHTSQSKPSADVIASKKDNTHPMGTIFQFCLRSR